MAKICTEYNNHDCKFYEKEYSPDSKPRRLCALPKGKECPMVEINNAHGDDNAGILRD